MKKILIGCVMAFVLLFSSQVILSASLSANAQQQLYSARTYFLQKNYKRALKVYNTLLKQYPRNVDLLIETARVYSWNNQHTAAIALYQHALQIAPNRYKEIILPLAWQELWANNADDAYSNFYHYHQMYPNDIEALRGLGATFYAVGDTLRAEPYFLEILKRSPSDIDARQRLSFVYLSRKNYSGMIRVNQEILKYRPNDKEAMMNIAQAYNLNDYHRKAILQYQKVLKRWPNDEAVKTQLAYAYYLADFDQQALDTLKNVKNDYANYLRTLVQKEQKHQFSFGYVNSSNSDEIIKHKWYIESLFQPDDIHRIYVQAHRARIKHGRQYFYNSEAMAGLGNRIGTYDSTFGTLWPTIYLGAREYKNWETFAWKFNAKWIPTDPVEININTANEAIETNTALNNHILFNYFSGDVDYHALQRLYLTAEATHGRFSKSKNLRDILVGRAMFQVFYDPDILIGPEMYYAHNNKPNQFLGYWDPRTYLEKKAAIDFRKYFYGFYLSLNASFGQFQEGGNVDGQVFNYSATLIRYFGPYGELTVGITRSHSSEATVFADEPGYRNYVEYINYTIPF